MAVAAGAARVSVHLVGAGAVAIAGVESHIVGAIVDQGRDSVVVILPKESYHCTKLMPSSEPDIEIT